MASKAEEKIKLGATEPADPLNIPLGTEVFDVVTGIQGTLTQRVECIGGNIRYGIQPVGDGKVVLDTISLDYHTLLIVGPGCSAVRTEVANPTSIRVKDRVKNVASGFEGIVLGKITFFNGCEYLEIQGEGTKEKPTGSACYEQALMFIKVDDGLNEKPAKVKAEAETKRPLGGPMTRIPAIRLPR